MSKNRRNSRRSPRSASQRGSGQPNSGQPNSGQPNSGQPNSGQPRSGQPKSGEQGPGRRPRPIGAAGAGPRTGFRASLERASTPVLMRLSALPGWVVPVLMLAVAVTGLFVGGPVGFALLLLVAMFLTWLATLSWPLLSPRTRVLRLLVPAAVLAAAVLQLR
ncbi:MAG: hypothetical protein L0Y54_10760 [Sporichthyaceae bacterium]|nr:hypothetical protein [Sporichthyaceae bacterium]